MFFALLLLAACQVDAPLTPSADGSASEVPSAPSHTLITVTAGAPSANILTGDSLRIPLNSKLSRARTVNWRSTNPAVASVTAQGLVVGLTSGSATVTAMTSAYSQRTTVAVLAGPASVAVSPTALVLPIDSVRQLAAWVVSATGVSLSNRAVAFTSANPSVAIVSSTGRVTAKTAGTTTIVASSGGAQASVAVSVPAAAPTLSAIHIAPKTATVSTGGTVQFTATALWSNGSTAVPLVSYSATGGTVTPTGLYTAPATAGTYQVILAQTSGALRDTAVVTVTTVVTPPPPSGRLANECLNANSAWIFCDDFDQNRLTRYFEVDNASGRFTRVDSVGNEGSFGMRGHFLAGTTNAGSLKVAFGKTPSTYFKTVDAGTANYRDVYWRFYVRNQAGWQGGGGDKLTRATSFSASTWAQSMIAHVWSGNANSAANELLVLDPASGTDVNGTLITTTYNDFAKLRWLGATSGTTPLYRGAALGQWHCVEAHVQLNDAGQSNGIFEFWVDDVLNARKSTLNWVGSYNAYGINAVMLENYWNSGSPVVQDRFFDNFIVSTQRIGC
ncbi:MAG: Ig-like domain-containing protein [Gemmatimonadaceae bacterium]|nr:Ig-like domain-containing protein [Gemmatimonadaceae bacterium]MCC6430101.1 Ig-like domain-containing protein [Gemmatimonadaceae bacterium]